MNDAAVRGKCHEKTEAQGGHQVKEAETNAAAVSQATTRAPKAGRGKEASSSGEFRRTTAPSTPCFQTSSLKNYKRLSFCCFKL